MLLLGMFLAAVAVGAMAQVWKGRTGVLWFVITAVVEFAVSALVVWSTVQHPETFAGVDEHTKQLSMTIATVGIGGGIMALAVASLPTKKTPDQSV